MPKKQYTEVFIVTVVSDKPINDMSDHLAGRVWPMDGVSLVEAKRIVSLTGEFSMPDTVLNVTGA